MNAVAISESARSAENSISSFWVATYPSCESVLFVTPQFVSDSGADQKEGVTTIDIFDSDGALVNHVTARFPAGQIGILELSQFMGGCKLDSGFKHGRIAVSSDYPAQHLVRIQSRDNAVMTAGLMILESQRPLAVPFVSDEKRSSMLVITNQGSLDGEVRVKLYLGTRSPEIRQKIPAFGSRLVLLQQMLSDCLEDGAIKFGRGYVKISTGSAGGVF